jgi:hypothetical protein
MNTMKAIAPILLGLASACALQACSTQQDKDRQAFEAGLREYLAQKGELCLAKYDWPIDVSEADAKVGTRDAVQMPVLEQLGLVTASDATTTRESADSTETVPVKRYALTAEGQKYFVKKPMHHPGPDGRAIVREGDFCAASLSLDKLVAWEPPTRSGDHAATVVTFTYKVDAAPWARDERAQRVFPMVARIIGGAGTLQLKEAFVQTEKGWRAKDLAG